MTISFGYFNLCSPDENDDLFMFCDDKSNIGVGVVRITLVVTVVEGVMEEHMMSAARNASTDDIMTQVEIMGTGLISRKPGGGGGRGVFEGVAGVAVAAPSHRTFFSSGHSREREREIERERDR